MAKIAPISSLTFQRTTPGFYILNSLVWAIPQKTLPDYKSRGGSIKKGTIKY